MSIVISEPTTTLTDYALGATGAYLGARLLRTARERRVLSSALWAGSFLVGSLAAFVGGSSHGFAAYIGPRLHATLWLVTYNSIAVASLLILAGALAAFAPRRWRNGLAGLLLLRLLVTTALLTVHRDMRYLIYDYSLSILVILGLSLHAWSTRRDPGAPWALAAVATSLVGAVIQGSRLAPHAAFNHNDLFHVIEIVSLYLFYRAGRLLSDRG
jgi:hypothetical protein